MRQLSRHAPRLAFAIMATIALAGGGATAAPWPTTAGAFLAGQQALADLRTGEAAQYFRNAATEEWDNPLFVERAMVALAADGRIPDAADMARHLLELSPDNEMANLILAAVELKDRRYPAVSKRLETIGANDIALRLVAQVVNGWALVGQNRAGQAQSELAKAGDEGYADYLLFPRALMEDVAGRSAEAIGLFKTLYENNPLVPRVVEGYARALGNAGRFDEAIDLVVRFEATGAAQPLLAPVKAALAGKKRPGPFAASVQAGASEMFRSIGIAIATDQGGERAMVLLRLGAYLDPGSEVVLMSIADILSQHSRYEAANAIYEGIPAGSPFKPLASVDVAQNYDAMGDREEAIRRLVNITKARPDDLDAVSVLGDLYRDEERYGDAAGAYGRALEITGGNGPSDWRLYYVRGIVHERNKEWPMAEADFQRALELSPDQPQVLNYLGYSWVDQGVNLDQALDMIQRAVAAAPNDGYIVDSLGWAYYRLARYSQAVQTLERAVQLLPNDAEINDHLGDAYWRAGRRLEAHFQWNIAGSVDEKGEVKARVQPKLAGGLSAIPAATAADEAKSPIALPEVSVQ